MSLQIPKPKTFKTVKTFTENLELTFKNFGAKEPVLFAEIWNFNTKSSNRFFQDKTSFKVDAIESLTFQFGLLQVNKKPSTRITYSFFV